MREVVDEIKEMMGYSKDTNLAVTLAKATSDLGIDITGRTAKEKANRIAEELDIESRC